MSDELENSASASESASASAAPAPTLAGAKPLNEISGTTLMVDADGIVDAILGAVQAAGMGEAQRKAFLASLSVSFGAEIAALDARLDALDERFVKTTGDQTIRGVKTFETQIVTPRIRNDHGPLVLSSRGGVWLDIDEPGNEVVRWGDLGISQQHIGAFNSAVQSLSSMMSGIGGRSITETVEDLLDTFGRNGGAARTVPSFGDIVTLLLGDSDPGDSSASTTVTASIVTSTLAGILTERLNEVLNGTSSIPNNRYAEGYAAGFSAGFSKGVGFGDNSGSGGGNDGGDNDDRYAEGYAAGYGEGYSDGYQSGYGDGYAEGIAQCSGEGDESGSGCFSDDYLAELEARIRALEAALAKAIALFNALKSFADALDNGDIEAPHLELDGATMVKAFRELVWPTAHS